MADFENQQIPYSLFSFLYLQPLAHTMRFCCLLASWGFLILGLEKEWNGTGFWDGWV